MGGRHWRRPKAHPAPARPASLSHNRRIANRSPAGHCCTERCWSEARRRSGPRSAPLRPISSNAQPSPSIAETCAVRDCRARPSSRYRRSAVCWHSGWPACAISKKAWRLTRAGQILDSLRDKAEIVRSDKGFPMPSMLLSNSTVGTSRQNFSTSKCPTPGQAAPAARPPA
jgi:hypothetical protein